jgi:PD-(D/E)XK nuclease superfamily
MPETPFPDIIDSTMRADFVACRKRFYYSHIKNLRLHATNVHLHFGACFAKGQETFRRSYWSEKSPFHRNFNSCFAAGASAIIKEWGTYEPEIETKKTLDACLDAFASYLEQYKPDQDPITPHLHEGEPTVEITFALPIPGVTHPSHGGPILYTGRYDMLAAFGKSPGLYVEDDKTTSALGNAWMNNWKLRSQFTGYVWAGKQYGYQISGVIIRGIAILKSEITHAQVIEQRPQWMIDRWLEQLRRDVEAMITCWREGYWDYALDGACTEYGGCPYLPLCTSATPENWESQYVVKPWNPLAKLST